MTHGPREPSELPESERRRLHDEPTSLRPIGYVVGPHEQPDDTPIQSLRNPDEHARVVVYPEMAEGSTVSRSSTTRGCSPTWTARPPTQGFGWCPSCCASPASGSASSPPATPGRPNPLALSLVRALSVEDTVLHFAGIDLCHRTPVLDIKPWEQHLDVPRYQPGLPQLDRIRGCCAGPALSTETIPVRRPHGSCEPSRGSPAMSTLPYSSRAMAPPSNWSAP